jgi:hypothetical protein
VPRRPPVALALVLLAAACSSSTGTGKAEATVPAVNGLSPQALTSCRTLKAGLPEQIGSGIHLRRVDPVSDTTAGWGDPVIALRCGVPEGSARDDPYTFNGVRWALHDTGASRTWTTLGRPVNVSVEIPDAYSSQAELVGKVSFVVATALS